MESKKRWIPVANDGRYWSYRNPNQDGSYRVLANVYVNPLLKKNKWRAWVPGSCSFEAFNTIKAAAAYAEDQVEFDEKGEA